MNPVQNFVDLQGPVVSAAWLNGIDNLYHGQVPSQGQYNSFFQSGSVQVAGAPGSGLNNYNQNAGFGDLIFGFNLPNLTGTNATRLLIGGAGKSQTGIITDAQLVGQHGIDFFLEAGDAATADGNRGGNMFIIPGAGVNGQGGTLTLQGGTSVLGPAGLTFVQGGNSTNGPAGDLFLSGGLTGSAGASVHILATSINGHAGNVEIRVNSTTLWTWAGGTGAIFPGNGLSGAGNLGDALISQTASAPPIWGTPGFAGNLNLSMSGSMTVTAIQLRYSTNGRQASIWTEGAWQGNSTGFNDIIISTLPTFLIPSLDRTMPCCNLINNGVFQYMGQAHIDTFGGITLSLLSPSSPVQAVLNIFSASGNKGISNGWCITYPL